MIRAEPADRPTSCYLGVIASATSGTENTRSPVTPTLQSIAPACIFTLRKVLPEGMVFPHDFGFLPRTLASDCDPIDVLLLMDVPAFPGCLVPSRLIGVLEGEQLDRKKEVRNDRLIAVAELSHAYKDWKKLNDLPGQFINELEAFFVNYHGLEGKKYKLLGCKEAKTALNLVKKSQRAATRAK